MASAVQAVTVTLRAPLLPVALWLARRLAPVAERLPDPVGQGMLTAVVWTAKLGLRVD